MCTKLFLQYSQSLNLKYFLKYSTGCKPIVVTVTGINSRVAQFTSLLLKQSELIDELRIFDFCKGPEGTALDLSHIDTNCKVTSFTGFDELRNAVANADVVVLCGGETSQPNKNEYELFMENADYVRSIALHTAEFNSNAIVCISTPPVTAMVPLVSEEYKKSKVYNPRKIMGITTLANIRANSIIGRYIEKDPGNISCPIVGADGTKTVVPVLSQTEYGSKIPQPAIDLLHTKISKAEDAALSLKYRENSGACMLSPAYATAKFVTSVLWGLSNRASGYEFAFIRQTGHIEPFLTYMTSVITLCTQGVKTIYMPYLNTLEGDKLKLASYYIRQQIKWGESYVTGEMLEKKRRTKKASTDCDVIKLNEWTRVGDKWV